MSQTPSSPDSINDLQFTSAEPLAASPVAAVGMNCAACGQPIVETYFAIGDKVVCPACGERVAAPPTGSTLGRILRASLLGLGAGILGALIWYIIRRVTNYEIGLVAIVVGIMVGKAVHRGSGGQGGRIYQVLAVMITYCCIAANYMPDVIEAALDEAGQQQLDEVADVKEDAKAVASPIEDAAPRAPSILGFAVLMVLAFGVCLAIPFLGGAQSLIGLLIIGFALWEAWRFSGRQKLAVGGPYRVGTSPVT